VNPLAVVSGAGSGIGAATAHRLAADGFDVLLLGRRAAALDDTVAAVRAASPTVSVTALPTDVTDAGQVAAVVERVRATHGAVRVIVNNAGSPAVAYGDDLAELVTAWTQTYLANVVSTVLLTTALEPLLERPGGRVIMVGSLAARNGTASPAYSAAKAALNGYLHATAARLGPDGVTVNIVAPGYTVHTELAAGRISPERHERLLDTISMNRAGEPEEVAAAISFVASPGAAYVTDQVLGVDGGYAVNRKR
jgi:3-oxoacyl-[acyl-carrier protein] reductase